MLDHVVVVVFQLSLLFWLLIYSQSQMMLLITSTYSVQFILKSMYLFWGINIKYTIVTCSHVIKVIISLLNFLGI